MGVVDGWKLLYDAARIEGQKKLNSPADGFFNIGECVTKREMVYRQMIAVVEKVHGRQPGALAQADGVAMLTAMSLACVQ